MADVAGLHLTVSEAERLCHPLIGGVILFRRNYESREQVAALVASIRALRDPELLIAVDHEGGRVQRFRDGFTHIPPMRALGQRWLEDPAVATALAFDTGVVLAAELRAVGVDLSFTPVLDLDWGHSEIIGDRSFGRDPACVTAVAAALIRGLAARGMASCGKHFPGHGWAVADSHHALPEDPRSYDELAAHDLLPFARLADQGLASVMPAHLLYPAVDPQPAGFSRFWLQTVLRERLGFDGAVFSDDLSMKGAHGVGDIVARAQAAFVAGCDMVLVCNDADSVDRVLDGWRPQARADSVRRICGMVARGPAPGLADLASDMQYQLALGSLQRLGEAAVRFATGPAVGEAP
ncbi:MAG: beta-N-acetylhexosaminidase [Rhodocyclaceae bacterium]|nr:beta-N-acetylhexosaminidase [Rhodocyclaceae bacterium]